MGTGTFHLNAGKTPYAFAPLSAGDAIQASATADGRYSLATATNAGRSNGPITGWEGHRPIVEAIERRDGAEAARLSDELLDHVAGTLVQRLASRQSDS